MSSSFKYFYSKCDQICSLLTDLVTFTEEILNDTRRVRFTQLGTRIDLYRILADSDLFNMFTQLIKFYTFHVTY